MVRLPLKSTVIFRYKNAVENYDNNRLLGLLLMQPVRYIHYLQYFRPYKIRYSTSHYCLPPSTSLQGLFSERRDGIQRTRLQTFFVSSDIYACTGHVPRTCVRHENMYVECIWNCYRHDVVS